MNNQKSLTVHVFILMGAFIIGLAFRLIRLGALALPHMEADLALQALAVARGGETLFGDHMAYVGLTAPLFFLFSSSTFLARLWPAIIGTLVVLVPYIFRKIIGLWPAIITSFLLVISPEMVALSRIIGSPMMALVFSLLTLGFWLQKRPILAGICLGLGLMSGPGFWVGLMIIGVSFGLSEWLFGVREAFADQLDDEEKPFWVRSALSFVFTLLVVGTGFFMAPAGLSGIFSGLYTFILGFGKLGLTPVGWIPFALLAYGTGAVIFGLWGGIRGILLRNKLDMFLLIWAGFGLLFIMLYPGSGPADLIWVTMPLWVLSGRVVFFAWRKPEQPRLVAAITAVMVVVISAFMLLAMRTLVSPTLLQSQQINYLIALVGGVVLVVAIILLVSYGWSEDIARSGLLLGLGLVICAGMISVSVNSTGIGPEKPFELWYADEAVMMPEWLQVTIDRTLVWNARSMAPPEIVVSGLDTPGMRWALHQYPRLDFLPYVPAQAQPGILITPIGAQLEISNAYQGQSLVWSRNVPWRELTPNQYLTWLVTREVPTVPQEVILWVRTDLMPGGQVIE